MYSRLLLAGSASYKRLFKKFIGKDRTVIPTRDIGADGKMSLKHIG